MPDDDDRTQDEKLLDEPTGGPAAKSASGEPSGDVDPSAGAAGQDEGDEEPEGAVEEAADDTRDSKPAPG
jgi:hypothetical protein